jgi:hypothetical protein
MLESRVVLPDADHFPDPYDKSEAAAKKMFCRVCPLHAVLKKKIR